MLEDSFKKNGGKFEYFKNKFLFDVKSNPQLNKSSFKFSNTSKYPYFTRTLFNNGVLGYVDYLDDEHKIKGNSIAIGMMGMKFFYMKNDFYAGQFTKTLYPKFNNFNEKIAMYFISLLNKLSPKLKSVLVRDFDNVFYDSDILLPVVNNEISFKFMEDYIKEVQKLYLDDLEDIYNNKLQSYLKLTDIQDINLTDEECCFLSSNKKYEKFKIENIFNKLNLKYKGQIFRKEKDISKTCNNEFNLPLVNAKHGNNGIMYYGRISDWEYSEMCLDIVNDGAISTGSVYPQVGKTGVLYNAYLIKPNNIINEITKEILFFLACVVEKNIKKKFSYDNKASWEKVKKIEISLPVNENGEIDCDYMERYIKIIEKLIINNFISKSGKKLNLYKSVI